MAPDTAEPATSTWDASEELDNLAREIVHAYEELHLLYELGETLTSQLSATTAANLILEKLLHALAASRAELRLVGGASVRVDSAGQPVAELGGASGEHRLETGLRSGGELLGCIVLERSPEGEPFSSADGKLLDAVGTLAGNAIRNSQLYGELRQQAEALRESEAHLRAVLENVAEGIVTTDEQGTIASFNRAAEQIFGHSAHEVLGREFPGLLAAPPGAPTYHAEWHELLRAAAAGRALTRETFCRRHDGSSFPAELAVSEMRVDAQRLFIVSVRDITERKQAEAALEHQALHDLLTDLPNRTLLHERLRQAILGAQRDRRSLALLVMDLDRFKEVNDTFGHHYGDLLLRQVGERLSGVLRETDTIARLGGDEFSVLLPRAEADEAAGIARRLLGALEAPLAVGGLSLEVGASIGIALYPEHGDDADTLLRRADVAMYVAKRTNSGLAIYSAEQDQHSPTRLALVGELRRAIEHAELTLYFQPKLSYRGPLVLCAESLVRWHHPRHGLIGPDQFVPLAEQTGLIRPLTEWVLASALRQCREWLGAGSRVAVGVNLSMRNLHDPQLPEMIATLLASNGVPPDMLNVEITESSLMADPARALDVLARLRSIGVQVAVDDFGTGYSSLAYLKRLPVDELKIDKSFVRHLATDASDVAIVRSTIRLGHDLGLAVVAEGVEDEATWRLLGRLGCDVAQGYYVSRPLPAAEFSTWLASSPWAIAARERAA